MDDVTQIVHELNDELRKRGIDANDANVKRKVEQVASDEAMVGRMRDLINAGQTINIDTYMQIRGAALNSRQALLGKDEIGPTSFEVQLVPGNADMTLIDALNAEIDRLRAEVADLKAKLAKYEVPA